MKSDLRTDSEAQQYCQRYSYREVKVNDAIQLAKNLGQYTCVYI